MADNLDEIMDALAKGPSPTEADIEKLVDWARRARARVAELESERKSAQIALSDAEQGQKCGELYHSGDLSDVADRFRDKLIAIGEAMGMHFGDDWECMAGAYGDNLDAIQSGTESLIARVAELEAELSEVYGQMSGGPVSVFTRGRSRVAERCKLCGIELPDHNPDCLGATDVADQSGEGESDAKR